MAPPQGLDWQPAKGGGSNFGTHRLKELSHRDFSFQITPMGLAFPLIFVVLGAIVTATGIPTLISNIGDWESYLSPLFGLIFLSVGLLLLRAFSTPRRFNLDIGLYWKGWKVPKQELQNHNKKCCPISRIIGIQLLDEYCKGSSSGSSRSSSSYYSYEINLVLDDLTRINVIDHGNRGSIQGDGKRLSELLNLPLWSRLA